MTHLLSLLPYEPVPREQIVLPPRQRRRYRRPPKSSQRMVPVQYQVD